ncbi:hypothetical protein FIBSPDRAFT_876716 [Athelia psychrophila]|uniref:Uncharacterized protein n=1 Tax=Athelia psychrophila TaxID=1759441 RepID=A0A167WM54_9AGAM|nr:hypothetical protein FIBSPDRAFT_876716 [Fibularhizoctonia sp. CBS 109695]
MPGLRISQARASQAEPKPGPHNTKPPRAHPTEFATTSTTRNESSGSQQLKTANGRYYHRTTF